MWQRIQTLYFIVVIVLMIVGIVLPSAEFYNSEQNITYQLDSRGIVELNADGAAERTMSINPCTYLFGMILFLATFCIFKFKDRKKQFRLATINTLLILLYIIALGVFVFYAKSKLEAEMTLNYPVVFPLIALIFNYLAMRGINKDEKLVRSADRLRK